LLRLASLWPITSAVASNRHSNEAIIVGKVPALKPVNKTAGRLMTDDPPSLAAVSFSSFGEVSP
jgi:hypothetical protein